MIGLSGFCLRNSSTF
ncbi:MAG: hypothetical protein ACLGHN_07110 [Bacteriovoracia bacterium]